LAVGTADLVLIVIYIIYIIIIYLKEISSKTLKKSKIYDIINVYICTFFKMSKNSLKI